MLKRITSRSSVASERPPSYHEVDPTPSSSASPPPFSPSGLASSPSLGSPAESQPAFVSVEHLKQHLLLLAAFKHLRDRVEADQDVPDTLKTLKPEQRWAVFVAMAVWRWELYVTQIAGRDDRKHFFVPPLDVILVWHTFQLNPVRWEEDTLRLFPQMKDLKGRILGPVTRSIDVELLEQVVPPQAVAEWEAQTGLPYDALENYRQSKGRNVKVPDQYGDEKSLFVPWIAPDGKGYAQQGLEQCSSDGQVWTHEALGAWKLAKDTIACRDDETSTLAGSVVASDCTPARAIDSRRAQVVRTLLTTERSNILPATSAYDLGNMVHWGKGGAWMVTWRYLGLNNKKAMKHILSYYMRGEPFSLDLQAAVLRQGTFIDKIYFLGWLDRDRFEHDEITLRRSVSRYHGFLILFAADKRAFCVPTLDIDLGWHTHQLLFSYKDDTVNFTGRFVDHNDKVEEGALSSAFTLTATEWQKRFGVPYTTCGCPLPPLPAERSLFGRLSRGSSTAPPPPPASSANLLPHPSDPFANQATHPSEHNALLLPSHSLAMKMREQRYLKLEERRKEEAKDAVKDEKRRAKGKGKLRQGEGELPPIDELEVSEKEKANSLAWRDGKGKANALLESEPEKVHRLEAAGDPAHAAAFFAPIPLNPIYGPSGYPIPIGGCASSNANVSGNFTVDSGSIPSAACIGSAEVGVCVTTGGSCASCMAPAGRGSGSGGSGIAGCGSGGCGGGGG
ncbi:hypothetical protein JCM11251_003338 [Rhodosporidiobolus azoricus]